jgi:Ca2+-binding RTX toxin-like protein
MNITIDISETWTTGVTIGGSHFGVNFVADYERIGPRGWEKFDNIVENLNITHLRYPGGTAAETVFDYQNPDQTEVTLASGEVIKLTSLSQYIDYCNQQQINPTIIIPTECLLTLLKIDGHRDFDENQIAALRQFIERILSQVDPNLTVSFELGNEYETYMSATEYGRVANALTGIICEVYDEIAATSDGSIVPMEPLIFVQVWAYSVGGGTTYAELQIRNDQVRDQFDPANLSEVDGVTSHYYFSEGRNANTDQAQTFLNIASQITAIASLHEAWEQASNRELISRVSEWNVLFRSETNLGLQQIEPLMEMFTSFLKQGFDALDFWSAQYHATSLASNTGRLMVSGVLFDTLIPIVIGTAAGESSRTDEYSSYTFIGEGRYIVVLTSSEYEQLVLDLENSQLPAGHQLVDGYIIGVNEATADGAYDGLTGLPAYGEPDATATVTQIPISVISGADSTLALESHETVILVFTVDQPGLTTVYGTDFADLLYGSSETPTLFIGGAGPDMVSYEGSPSGVSVDLSVSASVDPSSGDQFVSIESLLGSRFSDTIRGTEESDLLDGRDGSDIIVGLNGNDTLRGGGDSDTIYGGHGLDALYGDGGDDTLLPGEGADSVFGGDGVDTLSFMDSEESVTVWIGAGVVEKSSGNVIFRGIERFVGSDLADHFNTGPGNTSVYGLSGNDSFKVVEGGKHELYGGDGDDRFFLYEGSGSVFGGAGDDYVFSYADGLSFQGAAGNDEVYSFGNNGIYEGQDGDDVIYAHGQSDEFIFSADSGHDTVHGFDSELDTIALLEGSTEAIHIEQTDAGSVIWFGEDSSVLLVDVYIEGPADIAISIL